MRWCFMGPFETIDLNAPEGIEDFVHRYADAYRAIGAGQRELTDWSGDTCRTVVEARRQVLSVAQLEARQAWRDRGNRRRDVLADAVELLARQRQLLAPGQLFFTQPRRTG